MASLTIIAARDPVLWGRVLSVLQVHELKTRRRLAEKALGEFVDARNIGREAVEAPGAPKEVPLGGLFALIWRAVQRGAGGGGHRRGRIDNRKVATGQLGGDSLQHMAKQWVMRAPEDQRIDLRILGE